VLFKFIMKDLPLMESIFSELKRANEMKLSKSNGMQNPHDRFNAIQFDNEDPHIKLYKSMATHELQITQLFIERAGDKMKLSKSDGMQILRDSLKFLSPDSDIEDEKNTFFDIIGTSDDELISILNKAFSDNEPGLHQVEAIIKKRISRKSNNNDDDLEDKLLKSYVIGGIDGDIRDFPYQLSLRASDGHSCGASIISYKRGLTAAHCYKLNTPYTVLAGSTSRFGDPSSVVAIVERFILHESFNFPKNDIAVLWFDRPLPWRDTIRSIPLPDEHRLPPYGRTAVVAGWGWTRRNDPDSMANILQFVDLPLITNPECKKTYGGLIIDGMICAGYPEGGRDACHADSGGALVVDDYEIGLVVGGYCASPNSPTLFTRVSHYLNWIRYKL